MVYPSLAKATNVEGKSYINLIVHSSESITNIEPGAKQMGWGCEEAAMWIIKRMPH